MGLRRDRLLQKGRPRHEEWPSIARSRQHSGVRISERKVAGNGMSHQVALMAGGKQASSKGSGGGGHQVPGVPGAIEMTRTESSGGAVRGDYRALVAAIQQQNAILQAIADTGEKNHALLEVIAAK